MSENITPYKDSDLNKKQQVTKMFDTISNEYDGLNRVISFGIDIKWRKKVVDIVDQHHPKNILEIGTYTGYSALCLAEGMQKDGEIHTIDINEELYDFQRRYFDASEYGNQIFQHLGNAMDIIPKLQRTFDLVFIDADKSNYLNYLEIILPKLKSGSVILSDNVLWSGKVIEEIKQGDKDTQVLIQYNKALNEHPRLETVLLPIRDGLTISRVK